MRDRITFFEKPASFDERMREGADMHCGLGGRMPLREEYEKPFHLRTHKTTRCNHDDDAGSY